jgi:hypothetical protein
MVPADYLVACSAAEAVAAAWPICLFCPQRFGRRERKEPVTCGVRKQVSSRHVVYAA